MTARVETLIAEFSKIVAEAHVRRGTDVDRIDGMQPQLVVLPGTTDEVAEVLRRANDLELTVIPQGGGTKKEWGNRPAQGDILLSMVRLDQVLEHAAGDMTATAQAGSTVTHLQQTLAQQGQRLALDPLWPERATIGGILATNDSGSLRLRFGSLRDLIIGITVALPDGTIARSGGKVVKNVAGYDLPKLMTGALGTLGVIVDATFRLHPLPRSTTTVTLRSHSLQSANNVMLSILDSTLVPSGVQCSMRSDSQPEVEVRFEGEQEVIEAQIQQLRQIMPSDVELRFGEQAWMEREALWNDGAATAICKISVLPSQLGSLDAALVRIAKPLRLEWELLTQAVGIGLVRLDASNSEALLAAVELLRGEIVQLGGSLVVLTCPLEVKTRVDVWGSAGSALPLMQRIHDHFDPQQMINRGRYLRY